jgi:hypothetical protein
MEADGKPIGPLIFDHYKNDMMVDNDSFASIRKYRLTKAAGIPRIPAVSHANEKDAD